MHIWPLGLSCETPAAPPDRAARGSHTTARELQTCTFQGTCASKHHQNSTRRPSERHKNSETVAGKGRKSAKFWAPHPSGPQTHRGSTLLGPHPSGPPPFGAPLFLGLGPIRGSTLLGGAQKGGAQKGGAPMGKTLKH